jgi:single-strand DNA-binding protein
MSQGKASLQVVGNVSRDPETRVTQSGMEVTRFSVAVNTKFKDREDVAFVDCTIFGKSGVAFAKFHRKGARVSLDGRLVQESWDDKATGQKRSKLCMIADSWVFVGSSEKSSEPDRQPAASTRSVAMSDADDTPF